jgi:hypothetical protein
LVRDFNFMAGRVEALVTSQRQLISDISHELRSPLARVNATLGLARQRLGDNVLFDRLERDAERLNELIGRPAALLVSGAICYALTRYLTGPVLRLRAAARRLAEGELTAPARTRRASDALACRVGALMIAKGMTLVFAGDPQAAYATGGALKPTHAVTLHAILVLPALAWLLSLVNWTERRRLAVVLVASAGYVVLAGVVAVGNFVGLEVSDVPAATVTLFAVSALLLIAAALLAVSAVARARHAGAIRACCGRPARQRLVPPPR